MSIWRILVIPGLLAASGFAISELGMPKLHREIQPEIVESAPAVPLPPRYIRELGRRISADPDDFVAMNLYAGKLFTLSRDELIPEWLEPARLMISRAVTSSPSADGQILLAHTLFSSHRFSQALELITQVEAQRPPEEALLLHFDSLFELGRYGEAEKILTRASAGSFENKTALLYREARLKELHGDYGGAVVLAERAAESTAESLLRPEDEAFFYLQWGRLNLKLGRLGDAERIYLKAKAISPENVLGKVFSAELCAVQGKYADAETAFRAILDSGFRPAIAQAFGDLLRLENKREEAAKLFSDAEAGYLQSVNRGEIYYAHHLAGLYADSLDRPADAERWAEKDLESRRSVAALDGCAWALYKNAKAAEAAKLVREALATGTRDPHVLYHASAILFSAGDTDESEELLREAQRRNPYLTAFHLHW